MPENNQALAEAVTSRVRELGWSQTTVAARGGPSTTSLTKITGGIGRLSPKMLAQIDRGMDWTAGTAARILAGQPVAELSLTGISNDDLLAEVRRRMEGAPWLVPGRPEELERGVATAKPATPLGNDLP